MATLNDSELTDVKRMLSGAQVPVKDIYKKLKHEFTVTSDGLLMRNNLVVIPKELQRRVIDIAHKGHQGIVRTKQLLRHHVWFTGIDRYVEETVQKCRKCQVNTKKQSFEPLRMSKMPEFPWENVYVDFYGPLSNGKYLFVLIDEHSRYPIVRLVGSTSFKALEPILDDIFS